MKLKNTTAQGISSAQYEALIHTAINIDPDIALLAKEASIQFIKVLAYGSVTNDAAPTVLEFRTSLTAVSALYDDCVVFFVDGFVSKRPYRIHSYLKLLGQDAKINVDIFGDGAIHLNIAPVPGDHFYVVRGLDTALGDLLSYYWESLQNVVDEILNTVAITTFTEIVPTGVTAYPPSAVTIYGTHFVDGMTVDIGGACTSVVVVNSTTITCVLPALANGWYDIVLTKGTQITTVVDGFLVNVED
jgi:hypothetical protein